MAEKRTLSQVREQSPTRVLIQDGNEEEEERYMYAEDDHMDVEDNDIHDAVNLNMDEIENEIDV
jgi:hypothetical protein